MPFRLPTFNLMVGIWRGSTPHTSPPDVIAMGNLSPGRIVAVAQQNAVLATPGAILGWMYLRLPALTDIRDGILGATSLDQVEVPLGSGRFYRAVYVDDIGKGFANEHRYAYLCKGSDPWPEPIP